MLIYANHLSVVGDGAHEAIFRGVGAWLREQLGFGLHPDQLRRDGEFNGYKGDRRSYLRIRVTLEEEPALWSWVLKHDADERGREWITELGAKKVDGTLELSCIVKTDEHNALVATAVSASQPRVVRYVINNVQAAENADFAGFVPGEHVRFVGQDRDSYRGLQAEIERRDREGPLVLLSPLHQGDYLIVPQDLQKTLVGLAQVVAIMPGFNSYEMAEVLGQTRSAWGGAINILFTPNLQGAIRNRLFLGDEVISWGEADVQRISRVLAWVTTNTNIPRLRRHVRPDGVMQLAARRQMQAVRARSAQMDTAQLRTALEEAARREAENEKYFNDIVESNARLETENGKLWEELERTQDESRRKDFEVTSLKHRLSEAGGHNAGPFDVTTLIGLASQDVPPSPLECLKVLEQIYGDYCAVLDSARESAEAMDRFVNGRELLGLLRRLVTDYRAKLMEAGDTEARKVFGKGEYAAKESETVMNNKAMRRQRTFAYEGANVEMFSHLKIGVADDETRTIRVHFHWDAKRSRIVIGYCGKHLAVSS